MLASEFQPLGASARVSPGLASGVVMAAISAVGLAAFLYPFFTAEAPIDPASQPHAGDAPLIFGALAALAATLFVIELASQGMNAKTASVLAVLATTAAALRLIPLPAGATAFFFLVILGGYVYGPRFGMLLGAMSLFVSAFAAGGLGPWVPFQMFAAAWMGLAAGWLGILRPRLARWPAAEIVALAWYGALAGFIHGALMNLWFWPYVATGAEVSWAPGLGIGETLRHYWAFYTLTSFGWDVWTALGNVVLIVLAGAPVLRVLSRSHGRFTVEWPAPAREIGGNQLRTADVREA